MELKIQKLQEDAKMPERAHNTDAGMDVFAAMSYNLRPGERALIKTGLAMAIPEGYAGLVWDKSGLSTKRGIKVIAGVIDAGYRGEVMIALSNLSDGPFRIDRGDKVAQILIQKIETPELVEVASLDDTERGDGGFGSTGK